MNLQKYRNNQLRQLTNEIGVYALCDLDQDPIYVGQSKDGIRRRVRRHLTSARSDVIANRQLDVWEIGYVWAWPLPGATSLEIATVECWLLNKFHSQKPLMNGSIRSLINEDVHIPEMQVVRILPPEEIERRLDPTLRLPRQAAQFTNLFAHILEVKNNSDQRRTLRAHFERLKQYTEDFFVKYKMDFDRSNE